MTAHAAIRGIRGQPQRLNEPAGSAQACTRNTRGPAAPVIAERTPKIARGQYDLICTPSLTSARDEAGRA
jgi:hypothetical protein